MACRQRERESGKTVKEIETSQGGFRLRRMAERQKEIQRERPLHPSRPPQGPAVFCADRTSLPGSHIQQVNIQ